jgi:protein SCO1/2
MRRLAAGFLILGIVAEHGCSRVRTHELRGQVLAVHPSSGELTVRHEDIRGFMPGMTMPFRVRPGSSVMDRKPGDLIRATLVVENSVAYLTDVTLTGRTSLTETPPARSGVDLLNPGDVVPDTEFVDQSGKARRLSSWRPRVVAVTFTYTRCPLPDFCPLIDHHFGSVQRAVLADPALRNRVQLLSVSIDPEFDTPVVLADHARREGTDPTVWSLLTGNREDILRFALRFGVSIVEDESSRNVVHNLRAGVIDSEGRLLRVLSGSEWTPAELIDAIKAADAGR